MLGIFDIDGSRELSKAELGLNADALGYLASDATWDVLVKRFGTVDRGSPPDADAAKKLAPDPLDLQLVGDYFSNKHDALLECVLRQMMKGLKHLSARCAQLELSVDELSGGAERDRQRKLSSIVRRWQHGLLHLAFESWAKLAAGQRALLNRVGRQWAQSFLAAVWRRWTEMVSEVQAQRQAVAQVVGRLRNRLAAGAFATWLDLVAEARARWATAERVLLRWLHQLLGTTFAAWREAVDEANAQRALVAQAVSRMKNRELSAAFDAWREAVATAQWQREVVANVMGKMRNRLCAMAFAAWYEAVEAALTARRELLQRVGNRLANRTATLAFERWREMVEAQREQVGRARQLAGRMLNALSGRCFDSWRSFVAEQRRILHRAAYAIGPGRLLSIAYFTWANKVAEAVRARELDNIDARVAAGIEAYMAGKVESLEVVEARLAKLPAELSVRLAEAARAEAAALERRKQEVLHAFAQEEEARKAEVQRHRQAKEEKEKRKQQQQIARVVRR